VLLIGTTDHLEDLDRQFSLAEDVRVTSIARQVADGSSPLAYALFDGQRIVRVAGDGVEPVARLDEPAGQCLAAGSRVLVVGLTNARLVTADPLVGSLDPVSSFGEVGGRAEWENPAAPTPDLRSAAITDSGAWLVNVHVGGVWRSTDAGSTWTNVVPPEADVHEVAAGSGGRVVAAAAGGVGWSVDDGATWEWTAEGLHAAYCRAVAVDGGTIFVTASTGPSTNDGRLYRGSLGGPMEPCSNGLPESFPFNLDTGTVDARDGHVALGARDGRVYRSSDGGDVFELVTERVGGRVGVVRFG
jgi:hypothetical protein